MQMKGAMGVKCPYCGTINDAEAAYCASCGNPIGKTACPNCGAELDPDADFCESCRRYIKHDVCSFCGARLSNSDAFCPECGSPRGGIVCPVCHTLNDFSFCKQCGSALTEEARQLQEMVHEMPEFKELQKLATSLQQMEQKIRGRFGDASIRRGSLINTGPLPQGQPDKEKQQEDENGGKS